MYMTYMEQAGLTSTATELLLTQLYYDTEPYHILSSLARFGKGKMLSNFSNSLTHFIQYGQDTIMGGNVSCPLT